MKNNQTKTMAYLAMYIALYIVLKYVGDFIPFLHMPNGGSIELELIAIILSSYHLGYQKGFFVCILAWLITIVLGFKMYFVHPIQILLDYVLPITICGISSILWPFKTNNRMISICMSILLGLSTYFGLTLAIGSSIYIVALIAALLVAALTFWYLEKRERFGIVIAFIIRYLSTVLSGVYFWAEGDSAGSLPAWIYSLEYNLGYTLVTMIVCIIIVPILIDALKHAKIQVVKE